MYHVRAVQDSPVWPKACDSLIKYEMLKAEGKSSVDFLPFLRPKKGHFWLDKFDVCGMIVGAIKRKDKVKS